MVQPMGSVPRAGSFHKANIRCWLYCKLSPSLIVNETYALGVTIDTVPVDGAGAAPAEVIEPNIDEDVEPAEVPGSDRVVGDEPAAAEVIDPKDEERAGSEVVVDERDGVVVEDWASPTPTVWTLVQTSRFSNKSEASTGMAAFEVNFTP